MFAVRAISVLGAIALVIAIFWAMGADDRGLGPVIQEMLLEPWSIVALVDLYLGFFIVAAVIFISERSVWLALIWALPIFVLGNAWTALWVVVRLPQLVRRLRSVA